MRELLEGQATLQGACSSTLQAGIRGRKARRNALVELRALEAELEAELMGKKEDSAVKIQGLMQGRKSRHRVRALLHDQVLGQGEANVRDGDMGTMQAEMAHFDEVQLENAEENAALMEDVGEVA